MNPYYCRFCGEKIDQFAYSNAVYCSDLCRKRSYDIKKRPKANRKAVLLVKGVVEIEK